MSGLKTRVGREGSISREGARLNRGGMQVGGVRGGSHKCYEQECSRGAAPRVRAVKSSHSWRGKVVSTLDGPIWSRYSIALTCPARSYFQRTLSKEEWGQGWDERYRSSGEGEE